MNEGIKTRYIVVGANGPIGSSFCKVLKASGQDILEVSHIPGSHQLRYDFLVDSPEKLNLKKNVNYVLILCSGYSNLADCNRNQNISNHFNIIAPKALLTYASNFNVLPVFLSSDNVFDGTKVSYDEEAEVRPLNLYGEQKLTVEKFIRANYARHLILRSSKVMGLSRESWVFRQLNELFEDRKILCFTDRYYAPVYLEDIPKFVMTAIKSDCLGTFHIAQDDVTTPFEIMTNVIETLDLPQELVVPGVMSDVKFIEPHPPHTYLSNGKAKQTTGMKFTSMEIFLIELAKILKRQAIGNNWQKK